MPITSNKLALGPPLPPLLSATCIDRLADTVDDGVQIAPLASDALSFALASRRHSINFQKTIGTRHQSWITVWDSQILPRPPWHYSLPANILSLHWLSHVHSLYQRNENFNPNFCRLITVITLLVCTTDAMQSNLCSDPYLPICYTVYCH